MISNIEKLEINDDNKEEGQQETKQSWKDAFTAFKAKQERTVRQVRK